MMEKGQLIYGGIIIAIIFFIIAQLVYAEKRLGGLSTTYITTFIILLLVGVVFAIWCLVSQFIFGDKEGIIGTFGALNENQDYRPLASTWARIITFGTFAAWIFFSVGFLGIQYFPEDTEIGPLMSSGSTASSAYYQSVPQMFGEDIVFMLLIQSVFVFIACAIYVGVFGRELTKVSFTVIVLIMCILPSVGAGYLIPGFALAHEQVLGGTQNTQFFISAASFCYVQSVIYQLTGLFLPIAHGAHNLMVSLELFFGLALGSIAIKMSIFYPIWRRLSWKQKPSSC